MSKRPPAAGTRATTSINRSSTCASGFSAYNSGIAPHVGHEIQLGGGVSTKLPPYHYVHAICQ
eukprot:8896994-Prorocentrum_lima.AAC.1